MKILLVFAACAVVIVFFGSRATQAFQRAAPSAEDGISNVNDILERANSGAPLNHDAPPDPRWVARMNAACDRREQRLAALPPATNQGSFGPRALRMLEIHRAHVRRISSFRTPNGFRAEVRELRRFNASQERILRRVARAAQAGDIGRASREALALRELAGRANTLLLSLGLSRCALRGSGMPL